MLVPDRHRQMLDVVRRHGSVRIEQLAEQFSISSWTVRRDLAHLEEQGLLRRTHGGAFLDAQATADLPAPLPGTDPADAYELANAKERIGRHAASLVPEGSTVMVLGGSTTAAMIGHLINRRLTVVTNGLDVANALRHAPDVSVVVLGGMLHRDQMTLLGPLTEAAMAELHVDVIVAGAHGIDAQVGVTGSKIIQAGHHRGMLQHADSLMVLADAGKLGRRGPTLLASLDQVGVVITDAAADDDTVVRLRDRDVAVDLV